MYGKRTRIATLVLLMLLCAGSAPVVRAQDLEDEVASVIERICTDAVPPCSDLGRLEYVPLPERWAIREALALLRHVLGEDDPRVRGLLDTPILTTLGGAAGSMRMRLGPAKGVVLRHAVTGELYLLLDSTELGNLPATLHLLVVGNAVRSQVLLASGRVAENPATVGAQQTRPEPQCELQGLALREGGTTLKLVQHKLAGMGVPVPAVLAAFDREIEGNRGELRFYLSMCGERA